MSNDCHSLYEKNPTPLTLRRWFVTQAQVLYQRLGSLWVLRSNLAIPSAAGDLKLLPGEYWYNK